MNTNKKLSNNEVDKILQQYGLAQIDEYVNNRTKIKCVDKDGYWYDIRIDNLQNNFKPQLWRHNQPYIEHNLQNFLRNSPIEFVSYKTIHQKKRTFNVVTLRCDCGNTFNVYLSKLVNNYYKFLMCNQCLKDKHPSGIKKTTKEYIDEFKKLGYDVVDKTKQIKPSKAVDIVDKDGYKGFACLQSCRQNKHFATFDITNNRKNFVYNANLWLSNLGIDTICNEFVSKEELSFTCGCGNEMILSQKQFRCGKYRCDSCTKKLSNLELQVKQYLDDNGINYIMQYKISDCRDKLPLPFDFYLVDFNTLIEVDGKQHYKEVLGGHEDFIVRKKHDNIKDEYCSSNNICLIRIPYFEFDNNNWEKYLNNFVKI